MPELPEVETIKRGLEPLIVKKIIRYVEVDPTTAKAFQGDEAKVADVEVTGIRRRGKALLIDLANGYTMMIHLRMTGQLIWRDSEFSLRISSSEPAAAPSPYQKYGSVRCSALPRTSSEITSYHDTGEQGDYDEIMKHQFAAGHPSKNFTDNLPNSQTRVTFVLDEGTLYFNDQRKFGFVKVLPTSEVEQEKFIAELAKEPWEMSTQELFSQCQRHKNSPIKAVLLDQKVIAGLGNIYADESLFYASVHPARKAGELSEEQVGLILEGARSVMMASIDSGGSTMATYIKPDGTTGNYLENFAQVFRREGRPCLRCGETILKTRVAGRGTHYCPHCQEAPDLLSERSTSSDSPVRSHRTSSTAPLRASNLPRISSQIAASDKMEVDNISGEVGKKIGDNRGGDKKCAGDNPGEKVPLRGAEKA